MSSSLKLLEKLVTRKEPPVPVPVWLIVVLFAMVLFFVYELYIS